jgi:uncharacterized protein (TIGR02246 family)
MKGQPMNEAEVTAEIQRRVCELAEAWNRGDLEAYDAVFAVDAEFVDTSARLTLGRAAIAAAHEQESAASLAGTEMKVEVAAVRPVSNEAAAVRIESRFEPGDRRVIMTAVFVQQDEDWQIIAAQASLKR